MLKGLEWLPLPLAWRVSTAIGRLLHNVTPRWRNVAHRNLALAMPELDSTAREEIVRGVYANLGRVLLSIARMPRLNSSNIREWIEYEGFEHYERALERGRGVLFLTAHLGNWELSAVAHALLSEPMHVMVRPLDNPLLDRLMDKYRTLCGNHTIRKRDSARRVLRALSENQAVGVLADQNVAGEDALFVDFFKVQASASGGVAKLAMRSEAAVIPGFALWKPKQRKHVLRFFPPIDMARSADPEADVMTNTQRCQKAIEEVIRQFPDQWLWIHRRWKTRPPGEPSVY